MFRWILAVACIQVLVSSVAFGQTSPPLWSKCFGGGDSPVYPSSVAVDDSGNVLVTGWFSGTVDLGGGLLVGEGLEDIFIGKFGPSGNHIWSQRFGGFYTTPDGDQRGEGITVDISGNVIATGRFRGTADFGGGPLTSAGAQDIFVAKFDAAGNHLWSKRFGDGAQEAGEGVVVDASGNVVVTGYFHSTVDFGGGTLTSAGSTDIFLAKFDSAGNHLWSKRFGDVDTQYPTSAAIDGSGNVILTGELSGTVDFGGGTLTSAGSSDIFVAKFEASGNHFWSKRFGDGQWQIGNSVTADASGNVVVTGRFKDTVDFGGGPLTAAGPTLNATDDIFVAKFDPNGNHLWSKRFGDDHNQCGSSVAVDGSGNVIVTGWFDGWVDFGGWAYATTGSWDIFVAKFDPNGDHLESQRFGDWNRQQALAVAADESGNVILTGSFEGAVDFGEGPLTCGPGGFAVKLADIETGISTIRTGDTPRVGAYPNPLNAQTTIRYSIPATGMVNLGVYDVNGRLVRVLVNEQEPAGDHAVTWDGRDDTSGFAASGVYFCRLEAGGVMQTKKLVLLK